MISEHLDFAAVVSGQTAKSGKTRAPKRVVVGPSGRESRDGMIVCREFNSQVVGVADVQEPSLSSADGNTAVSERMPEQGDQERFETRGQRYWPCFQSEPPRLRSRMHDPIRPMRELHRRIPPMADAQPGVFLFGNVNRCRRKIGQSTGVIRIAVREDNVPHIRRAETQPLDLPDGRERLVKLKPCRFDGGLTDPLEWMGDVVQPDTRVDERKAVVTFEQQAVAGRFRIRGRVEDAAIQVVNSHGTDVDLISCIRESKRHQDKTADCS
jgi:hypothetical protein